jgi:hypothetical protein
MSEPTDPIDSKEFYELMQRYRHASAIVPASVTNAFNDVKYFIVKLLRAQRTEGRPADIRTACPHCGLFGNHLASCEYEKFTKPDQPEPDFIIHRGAFFLGLATGLCFGFLFRGWLHEWRTGR